MNPIVFSVTKISDDRGGLYNIATNDAELGELNYYRVPKSELFNMMEILKDCFATDERNVIFEEVE